MNLQNSLKQLGSNIIQALWRHCNPTSTSVSSPLTLFATPIVHVKLYTHATLGSQEKGWSRHSAIFKKESQKLGVDVEFSFCSLETTTTQKTSTHLLVVGTPAGMVRMLSQGWESKRSEKGKNCGHTYSTVLWHSRLQYLLSTSA